MRLRSTCAIFSRRFQIEFTTWLPVRLRKMNVAIGAVNRLCSPIAPHLSNRESRTSWGSVPEAAFSCRFSLIHRLISTPVQGSCRFGAT